MPARAGRTAQLTARRSASPRILPACTPPVHPGRQPTRASAGPGCGRCRRATWAWCCRRPGALGRVMSPGVVARHQRPLAAVGNHRALDNRGGEVGAIAVPDELGAVAVLACFRGRTRVGVQVDAAIFLSHLGDGACGAGMHRADEKAGFLIQQHVAGDRGRALGVAASVRLVGLDAPAQDAAARIELRDRHADSALLVLAAGCVQAGVVCCEADQDRLLRFRLSPHAVDRPWAGEGGGGSGAAGKQGAARDSHRLHG